MAISIPFDRQIFTDTGAVAAGAKVSAVLEGTATPTDLYTDEELATPAARPAVADAAGRITLYIDPSVDTEITITDADDVPIGNAIIYKALDSSSDSYVIVDTLSELQNLVGTSPEDAVHLLGRSSAGDGAAGLFRWDSSDLSTEVAADEVTSAQGDGGEYVAPSSDLTGASGAWVRTSTNGRLNVLWYGVTLNSSGAASANVTAIQTATDRGKPVDFPAGIIYINGSITGGNSGWYGASQGSSVYGGGANNSGAITQTGQSTAIICSGTNSGNPFLTPPRDWEGFYVEGDTLQGVGVAMGTNGTFIAFRRWRNITVRNFDVGIDCFNFYSSDWSNMVIASCNKGVRVEPTDGAGDDGYWTSWSWHNVHIAFCGTYGLRAIAQLQARTWSWHNVVIEQNGFNSGAYQVELDNVVIDGSGVGFEGETTIPAVRTASSGSIQLLGCDWYFNATGGIDCNSAATVIAINKLLMVAATDTIDNTNSNCRLSLETSTIQSEISTLPALVYAANCTINGTLYDFLPNVMSLGRRTVRTPARDLYFATTTYSGTINANSINEIVTDQALTGVMADSIGYGSLQEQHPGLLVQVTPGASDNTDEYSVQLINVTSSNITVTDLVVNIMIWKAESLNAV